MAGGGPRDHPPDKIRREAGRVRRDMGEYSAHEASARVGDRRDAGTRGEDSGDDEGKGDRRLDGADGEVGA